MIGPFHCRVESGAQKPGSEMGRSPAIPVVDNQDRMLIPALTAENMPGSHSSGRSCVVAHSPRTHPRTTLSALVATTPSPKRSIGVAAGESFPTNLMRALAPMNDLASAVWSHASNPDVGMAVLLVSRGCWPVSPKPWRIPEGNA